METYTVRLEKSGRILIPVAVRRQLGLSEGAQVILRVCESSTLAIKSRSQVLEGVRARKSANIFRRVWIWRSS